MVPVQRSHALNEKCFPKMYAVHMFQYDGDCDHSVRQKPKQQKRQMVWKGHRCVYDLMSSQVACLD